MSGQPENNNIALRDNRLYLVLIACLCGLVLRLLHALDLSKFSLLFDDSFYSLSIARNIAEGHGITCGGIPTSGFQPLFVLLAAPFFRMFDDNSLVAIRSILLLSALISSVTPLFLYKTLRHMGYSFAAMVVATIWALSPFAIYNDVNGLETGLAGFFVMASFYLYLTQIRSTASPTNWSVLVLGGLLGFGFLARVDLGLWAVALTVDYLICGREKGLSKRVVRFGFVAIVALAVASLWFIHCYRISGSLMPASGHAVRFISLAYGFNHWGENGIYLSGFRSVIRFLMLSAQTGIREYLVTFDLFSTILTFRGFVFLVVGIVCLCWRTLARVVRRYPVLLMYPVGVLLTYSFYIFGQWYFPRYFYSASMVGQVLLWCVVDERIGDVLRKSRIYVLVWFGCVGILGALAWNSLPQVLARKAYVGFPSNIFNKLERMIPAGQTIGMFQSGTGDFFLRSNRVVNLDGVVNHHALDAMCANRMHDYLMTEGITWLHDWEWIIDALYVRRAGVTNALDKWELVERSAGFVTYRLRTGATDQKQSTSNNTDD